MGLGLRWEIGISIWDWDLGLGYGPWDGIWDIGWDFKDCVKEFSPTAEQESLREPLAKWLGGLLTAWRDILKPILQSNATVDLLISWVEQMDTFICSKSTMLMQQCVSIFADTEWFFEARRCNTVSCWLRRCHEFLTGFGEISLPQLQSMQKDFIDVFKMAGETWTNAEMQEGLGHLKSSPLFAAESEYQKKCRDILHGQGCIYANKFGEAFAGIVGPYTRLLCEESCSVKKATDTDLQGMASAALQDEDFDNVRKWAIDTADGRLLQQVSYMTAAVTTVANLGGVEMLVRRGLSAKDVEGRAITQEQVEALTKLRAQASNVRELATQNPLMFARGGETNPDHLPTLDDSFDLGVLTDAMIKDAVTLVENFGNQWSRDIKTLSDTLEKACPNWSVHRETLLTNTEMVEAMCSNPLYGHIGPLQQKLNHYMKMIKSLHADRRGAVVEATLVSTAKTLTDLGVETVAFTFFLYKLTRTFKMIENPTILAKEVAKLREELKPSGVVLTEQMEQRLEALANGEMVAEAPEPVAALAMEAPVIEAEAPEPVAAPPCREHRIGEKRSLAERARAATRRRIA